MPTWLAIPGLAVLAAALAVVAGAHPFDAAALGALAAALAGAVRAFAGPSVAATIAAGAGALLGVVALLAVGELALARPALAGACGLFAIAELARPLPVASSPWPALGAAVVAGVLDPSYVALAAIAGVRLVRGPWPRPRGAIALPIAGGLAIVLALAAALAGGGTLAKLWSGWVHPLGPLAPLVEVATTAGDALGPLAVVAAVVGLVHCAAASRFAAAGVLAVTACAALASARAGGVMPGLPIVAALASGVAVARLAALVRHPAGQVSLGAAASVILVASSSFAAAWR